MITHKAKAGALLTGTEYEATDAHREPVTTVAATGATEALSAAVGAYDLTLDQACTFSLTGATDDELATIVVILRGAFATTWPASVTWLNGAPATASLVVVTLMSVDGGTEWLGTASREPGPVYDIEEYTGGDISLGSVAGVVVTGPSPVTVAAVAGDLLMVGVHFRSSDADTDSIRVDMATIVSGNPVNYLSSRTGTELNLGVPGWFIRGSQNGETASGEFPYVVQAGDLSAGTVSLNLAAWGSGAGKVLLAQTIGPLTFWVRNLGQ